MLLAAKLATSHVSFSFANKLYHTAKGGSEGVANLAIPSLFKLIESATRQGISCRPAGRAVYLTLHSASIVVRIGNY